MINHAAVTRYYQIKHDNSRSLRSTTGASHLTNFRNHRNQTATVP
jgi:hypothetical protein